MSPAARELVVTDINESRGVSVIAALEHGDTCATGIGAGHAQS